MDDGELILSVTPADNPGAAFDLLGWTDVSVKRGCERVPNEFSLGMTERYPGEFRSVVVQEGDACVIKIGGDIVLTGYIDEVSYSITSHSHGIRVSGRGKCQDLIDCSAEWPTGQISGSSALQVAQKLAQPYGIKVRSDVTGMRAIPQFNLMYGESAFSIIERICRYSALLAYEHPAGDLFLTRLGTTGPSSGLMEGKNMQEAAASRGMRERYSEYRAYALAMNVTEDIPKIIAGNVVSDLRDPSIRRHRAKFIVAETVGGQLSYDLVRQRNAWEMNRRNARGRKTTVITDSWRDVDGKLWTPNSRIDVVAASLKLDTRDEERWVIGAVDYLRGPLGTTTAISAMPSYAFVPQPILLQPTIPDAPILARPPSFNDR